MAWLDVIGTGAGGLDDLAPGLVTKITNAELVIGTERILEDVRCLAGFAGTTLPWPSPFLEIIPLLKTHRDKKVVILATGDPLWYGAASTLIRFFSVDEICITPAVSGFQYAASRMGWPLGECVHLTVHGRPHERVIRHLAPGAKILILAHDSTSSAKVARLLDAAGYGQAVLTALGHIGTAHESRTEARATEWDQVAATPPDFHVIAVACPPVVMGYWPPIPGLADEAFESDGTVTKSEVRAATLARLKPRPGGVLWDLGCGAGSIGIEWMRCAHNARAIGIDKRQDRLDTARRNAARLGVPEWQGMHMDLTAHALDALPQPDAVFIGGGLSETLAHHAMARLTPGGMLVVNTVTLESDAILLRLWQTYGGEVSRLAISRAEPVGSRHGWRPLMPITQWVWQKTVQKNSQESQKPTGKAD